MQLNLSKFRDRNSNFEKPNSIKNIIFDFGGVICNIDVNLTKQAFRDLGMKNFDTAESITNSAGLFEMLEVGRITPSRFREGLRPFFQHQVSDEQLDAAWNAMLLDIPESRIMLLEGLRDRYRIFLLSNSNEIHYNSYIERFRKRFGYTGFDALFEKAWFSWQIGLKKPLPEIFTYALTDGNLKASETLFIDDTLVHTQGAASVGIHAYHLRIDSGEQIMELFG